MKLQICIGDEPRLVKNLCGRSSWITATALASIDNLLPVYRLAFHPIPVGAHFVHPRFHHKSSRGHVGVEPLGTVSSNDRNRSRAETIRWQFEIEASLVRPGRDPRLRPGKLGPGGGAVLEAYAVPRRSLGAPPHANPLTGGGGAVGTVGGEEGRLARRTFLDRQHTVTNTVSQRLRMRMVLM